MRSINNKNGYVTLISVLLVCAIGTAIAVTLLLLSIGSAKTSSSLEQSNEVRGLTNACAESALQQIRNNPGYSGTATLTLGDGQCTYTVTQLGGSNIQVTTSGTIGTIVRRVRVTIDSTSPTIHITSWNDVAN